MAFPTTLATLLAYARAPYQLADGRRCELVGFDFREEACAHIEYLDAFGTWERGWATPAELIPLLRGFNALVEALPAGEIPVIAVARLQGHEWPDMVPHLHYDAPAVGYAMALEDYPGVRRFFISTWAFGAGHLNMEIINYLRDKGFAVGLEPEQYIDITTIQDGK